MPFEIKLSQLQDRVQFEQAVAEHIGRLVAFGKEVGTPRPVAHPLVEAAIKRISHPKSAKLPDDYAADYVVIDDAPPPPAPLNLEDRKRALHAALAVAEIAAKEAILPQRKHRLTLIKLNAANVKLRITDGVVDNSALSDDDKKIIESYKVIQERYTAIELIAAQAESDIEDLTEDTIDSWQQPQFG